MNVEPPNPVSLAFHDRRGFVEVARREGAAGKIVSLRARSLG